MRGIDARSFFGGRFVCVRRRPRAAGRACMSSPSPGSAAARLVRAMAARTARHCSRRCACSVSAAYACRAVNSSGEEPLSLRCRLHGCGAGSVTPA
jgi:hypothetical protein